VLVHPSNLRDVLRGVRLNLGRRSSSRPRVSKLWARLSVVGPADDLDSGGGGPRDRVGHDGDGLTA